VKPSLPWLAILIAAAAASSGYLLLRHPAARTGASIPESPSLPPAVSPDQTPSQGVGQRERRERNVSPGQRGPARNLTSDVEPKERERATIFSTQRAVKRDDGELQLVDRLVESGPALPVLRQKVAKLVDEWMSQLSPELRDNLKIGDIVCRAAGCVMEIVGERYRDIAELQATSYKVPALQSWTGDYHYIRPGQLDGGNFRTAWFFTTPTRSNPH
jgi:hypothetical protein